MPESYLFKKLKHMLGEARLRIGERQKRTLDGGLTLEIAQGRDGQVFLQLSRQGVEPSRKEWETVLKYWPEALPDPRPIPVGRKEGPVYFRTARWPRPLANAAALSASTAEEGRKP